MAQKKKTYMNQEKNSISLNKEKMEWSISLESSIYKDPKHSFSNHANCKLGYLSTGICSSFTFTRVVSGVFIPHNLANSEAISSLNKYLGNLSYLQTQSLKSSQVTSNGLLPCVSKTLWIS